MTQNFNWNLLENIANDAQYIGGNINDLVLGTFDNLAALTPWGTPTQKQNLNYLVNTGKQYFNNTAPTQIATDFANAMLDPYNTRVEDFGKLSAGEIAKNMAQGAWMHPVQAGMDIIPFTGVGKAGSKIAKAEMAVINARGRLERTTAGMQGELDNVRGLLGDVTRAQKEAGIKVSSEGNLSNLIRAAEVGEDIPDYMQPAFNALRNYSDEYSKALTELVPEVDFNPQRFAVQQKILRDNLEGRISLGDVNFADIGKMINEVETLKANGMLEGATASMKSFSTYLDGVNELAESGRIFPVTHFGLEAGGIGKTVAADKNVPVYARERVYGNTDYDKIAKLIIKDRDALPNYMWGTFREKMVFDAIKSGEFVNDIASKNILISAKQAESGNLLKAIKAGLDGTAKVTDGGIYLDKGIAKDIAKALEQSTSNSQLAQLGKQQMLAGGGYIGGNILGQTTNALPLLLKNAPQFLEHGIPSERTLKNFGLYTAMLPNRDGVLNKINQTVMNPLYRVDQEMQNLTARISLGNELNKLGIADPTQIPNAKLREIQQNVLADSLKRREIPVLSRGNGWVGELGSGLDPFMGWTQTATMSTLHALRNKPLVANVLASDIAGNAIMQSDAVDSIKLKVNSPEPFKRYQLDKDGNITERSLNFYAPMTPIELIGDTNRLRTVPFWGDVVNAMQGRDRFGRLNKLPNTTIVNGTRYKIDRNGQIIKDDNHLAEVGTAVARNLLAPAQMFNRTVAPLISSVPALGGYNQPYATSLLGNFGNLPAVRGIAQGNPDRQRTAADALRSFTGVYSQPYYPNQVRPTTVKAVKRRLRDR